MSNGEAEEWMTSTCNLSYNCISYVKWLALHAQIVTDHIRLQCLTTAVGSIFTDFCSG